MEDSYALGRIAPQPPAPRGITSIETDSFFLATTDGQTLAYGVAAPQDEPDDEQDIKYLFSVSNTDLDNLLSSFETQIQEMMNNDEPTYGELGKAGANPRRSKTKRGEHTLDDAQISELADALRIDIPFGVVASPSQRQDSKTSRIIGGIKALNNMSSHDSRNYLRFFEREVKGTNSATSGFTPLPKRSVPDYGSKDYLGDTPTGFPPLPMQDMPPNRAE
jgi:hypothetical protein